MLTVAIANERAAQVRHVMFTAARRQVTQAWLVGTLVTAITSFYEMDDNNNNDDNSILLLIPLNEMVR